MSKAMRRPMGQMPAWLVFSGVAIGVVGASLKKHAESVRELVVALSRRTENSDAAVAVPLGQWGLLLLVAGAVVVVAGLVMIALAGRHKQRRRATNAERCSGASGDAMSAPSLPPKPSQRVSGARAA
jgi:hypothetical protein